MKKRIISIFLSSILCFSLTLASCGDTNTDDVALVNWKNSEESLECGSKYSLRKFVEDEQGNKYNVQSTVLYNEEKVETSNYTLHLQEEGEYTILYETTATSEGISVTLTSTPSVLNTINVSADTTSGTAMSQTEIDALHFAGSVEGNVYKYEITPNAAKTHSYKLGKSKAEFIQAAEEAYSNVSFYVAAATSNGKAARLYASKDVRKPAILDKAYVPALNAWTKISIALTDDLINKIFDESGNLKSIQFFNVFMSKENRVNSDGSTANLQLYVSDIVFDESTKFIPPIEGEIVKINNQTSVENLITSGSDGKPTFASALETADFAGAYEGNAAKFDMSAGLRLLQVTPRMTETEFDTAVENGYNQLSVWVAAYADNQKPVRLVQDNTFLTSTINLTDKTWQKVVFTFDTTDETEVASFKEKLFLKGGARLFCMYMSVGDRTEENGFPTTMHFYIGDVYLEKTEPRVYDGYALKAAVDAQGYEASASYNATIDYFSYEKLVEEGVSTSNGEYLGNAVRFTIPSAVGKELWSWGAKARTSVEKFDRMVEAGYTKLYMWVYIRSDYDGLFTLSSHGGEGIIGTNVTNVPQGEWVKIESTYTMAELRTKFFSSNGTSLKKVNFFKPMGSDLPEGAQGKIELFIGDIGFEKGDN